jgi:hypothetical protein
VFTWVGLCNLAVELIGLNVEVSTLGKLESTQLFYAALQGVRPGFSPGTCAITKDVRIVASIPFSYVLCLYCIALCLYLNHR